MSAIAQTTAGIIEGTEENGLCIFRGVPFAAPPVGDLRFKAPRPVESWDGVREAKSFGPISLQAPNEMLEALLPASDPPQPQSEDCLYLNVWTPGLEGARPVMVWIHGGAFTIGSGSEDYYDGASLASRGDVVIVTINYRLGALGFLNLPALGETNFGMRDQVAALKWVQANIANFGGDPGNVTIFGESAGGMSVASLMASPEAAGLFQKAIPQSGAAHNALSVEETNATAFRFCQALGVDPEDVDALMAADPADILAASVAVDPIASAETASDMADAGASATPQMPFQPVIDGAFLSSMPIEHIRAGSADGIATLVGSLDEEMKLLAAAGPGEPMSEEAVTAMFGMMHPDAASAYGTYRAARRERGEDDSPDEIFVAAIGDVMLRVPGLRLADAQTSRAPTYAYLFDWKSPGMNGALGSCHALELPFVFGTHAAAPEFCGSGPVADAFSELTMDTWLNFARTGNPAGDGVDAPAWDANSKPIQVLGDNPRVEHDWRGPEVGVWDEVIS
ncbi:MAG: carboxylesterase/lipase family protein [Chloroflexota bacterium]|nr:carboxylesterase/lipase family protein [Chloroflexota bacterium]MDE2895635.1 carboxylesterase/lipase family protein [Chloroflexota bacterium]